MPQSKRNDSDILVLIEPYLPEIRGFFTKRAGAQAADDLIQLLNLRLILYPPPEPPRSVRGFLYCVCAHVLHRHRQLKRIDAERFMWGADASQHVDSIVATDFVSGLEAADELAELLKALPVRQASALMLRRRDGYSYEEIAKALGVSKDTIKKDLLYALRYVNSKRTRH